ncbi:MAG: hypothetical protein H0U49_09180 [Parachlamydiaceae bacterium]|nr:hypothetical protein [Parachlamydiaceae bacterium]
MSDVISKIGTWVRKVFPKKTILTTPFLFNVEVEQPLAMHSGNIGDVIFSCLFLNAFWQRFGRSVKIHLRTNVPVQYAVDHPLKSILMNDKMAQALRLLLLKQPYVSSVTVSEEKVNATWNLDSFRALPIDYRTGVIPGYFQLCTDLFLNAYEPWLEAPNSANIDIIVSRTSRLNSAYINYKFLAKYQERLTFLGIPEEYERFVRETSIKCRYYHTWDFVEIASMIKSCKLFIGNQGFLYTLAESLKCPRVLETNSIAPNNYPMSSNGRMAIFQNQFESFIAQMLGS